MQLPGIHCLKETTATVAVTQTTRALIGQLDQHAFPPFSVVIALLLWTEHAFVQVFVTALQQLQDDLQFTENHFNKHCCGCHQVHEEVEEPQGYIHSKCHSLFNNTSKILHFSQHLLHRHKRVKKESILLTYDSKVLTTI